MGRVRSAEHDADADANADAVRGLRDGRFALPPHPDNRKENGVSIKFYQKRAIVIEAGQIGGGPTSDIELAEWCGGQLKLVTAEGRMSLIPSIEINTKEGVMTASAGDWIIKGVAGEFYPCKPEIFAATYDEVEP